MDSGLDLFYEQRYGNRCNLPCFYINSPNAVILLFIDMPLSRLR